MFIEFSQKPCFIATKNLNPYVSTQHAVPNKVAKIRNTHLSLIIHLNNIETNKEYEKEAIVKQAI